MFSLWILRLLVVCVSTCSALYPSTGDVINLTEDNFDKLISQTDTVWVVEFYAPWCGHCQQFASEYAKAAKALKGIVKVGGVNADENKSLAGRFGVRGFPTVKIFAVNRFKPEEFNGQRTAQAVVDAALAALKSKAYANIGIKQSGGSSGSSGGFKANPGDVIQLTESNFDKTVLESEDMWLVEFFAPWCGHCKNLEPQWAQAATELKGKVKLGALDATVHQSKASEYGVQGYPTIKFFPAGKKDRSSVEDFNGGRTASDIVNWALEKLAEQVPPPEIKQVVNNNVLKEACEDKPLCVISVLPHILDCQSNCRNGYLDILKEMGDKFRKKMWGWVWSEAGSHPELENSLEIGGFGYPAMAVLNAKKMKYSILRGSFSKDGINEFLRDLSYGRGTTAPVKGAALPNVSNTEPWDGKDGELPQEEDIDLSDVDLEDMKDEL